MKQKRAERMEIQEGDIIALYYMQRYGFLTIKQAVSIIQRMAERYSSQSAANIARRLLQLERIGYVGSFGNVRVGFGKAPKVYYIRRPGYDLLIQNKIPEELTGPFKKKSNPKWSPVFMHRMELIDTFLSLEVAVKGYPDLELLAVFLDYNRTSKAQCETMDFVDDGRGPDSKIIPDGAFVLRNHQNGKAGLYLVELDKGTESVTSRLANDRQNTLYSKMQRYDKYLTGGNFRQKYDPTGELKIEVFRLLFVTTSQQRINNIRQKMFDLPAKFHRYYFFNTIDQVKEDFFNEDWKIRSKDDNQGHRVI